MNLRNPITNDILKSPFGNGISHAELFALRGSRELMQLIGSNRSESSLGDVFDPQDSSRYSSCSQCSFIHRSTLRGEGYFFDRSKPGAEAESEAPGESVKVMGEEANFQHSRAATGVLEEILSRGKIKVAPIQEPWCYKGRIRGLNLKGGQIISCISAIRPRACIYVNGVDAMPLPQLSTMDLAAAVLSFQERNMIRRIVICSSSLRYDSPDPPPNRELEDLVNFCKTKSWDLLVGCDSNSHHSVWGSSDVNPRGKSLLEYLMTTELQLLNRGSQPTFRNSVREEVIDITQCTSNRVHKIKEWRVSGETSLSDHCHILFTLSEEARQVIAYRDPKATNWDLYRSELKRDIEGIYQHKFRNQDEIEASVTFLHRSIISSYEKSCPLKVKKEDQKLSWWGAELEGLHDFLELSIGNNPLMVQTKHSMHTMPANQGMSHQGNTSRAPALCCHGGGVWHYSQGPLNSYLCCSPEKKRRTGGQEDTPAWARQLLQQYQAMSIIIEVLENNQLTIHHLPSSRGRRICDPRAGPLGSILLPDACQDSHAWCRATSSTSYSWDLYGHQKFKNLEGSAKGPLTPTLEGAEKCPLNTDCLSPTSSLEERLLLGGSQETPGRINSPGKGELSDSSESTVKDAPGIGDSDSGASGATLGSVSRKMEKLETKVRASGAERRRWRKERIRKERKGPPTAKDETQGQPRGTSGSGESHTQKGSKRPRVQGDTPGCSSSHVKKAKLSSYAEAAKGKKKMAIIPESYPAAAMTQEWHIEMEGKLEELWGSTPEGSQETQGRINSPGKGEFSHSSESTVKEAPGYGHSDSGASGATLGSVSRRMEKFTTNVRASGAERRRRRKERIRKVGKGPPTAKDDTQGQP
ncbi:hypothetical protein J437_LFUL019231 [Ladona fulva]|uniref:Endonuclease/exonuclease/phosphatase domain-containing protein n=1 Tax=Ladona fulva TaxID=123851 RepID=A0A8K0PDS8_LADFU|nr:hypothetical protein J437_LFUL019231 [Ladona fulva]